MRTAVYMIAHIDGEGYAAPPVKIGVSADPPARLRQIQTSNPYDLKLYEVVWLESGEAALEFEKQVHRLLPDENCQRLRGEWFDVHPDAVLGLFEHKVYGSSLLYFTEVFMPRLRSLEPSFMDFSPEENMRRLKVLYPDG